MASISPIRWLEAQIVELLGQEQTARLFSEFRQRQRLQRQTRVRRDARHMLAISEMLFFAAEKRGDIAAMRSYRRDVARYLQALNLEDEAETFQTQSESI